MVLFIGCAAGLVCIIATSALAAVGGHDANASAFRRFLTEKEKLVFTIAKEEKLAVPDAISNLVRALRNMDFATASNQFYAIESGWSGGASAHPLPLTFRQPLVEAYGAFEQLVGWNPKFLTLYASNIFARVSHGSMFFGGTDPGRFIPTFLSESHSEGRPFFIVTQNALADMTYLDYVRRLYGSKIRVLTQEDASLAFSRYMADAEKRKKEGRLRPDEQFQVVNGNAQVSGNDAVMAINAEALRLMVEQNSKKEFFIEQSYPLSWTYGHLEPAGLIFRLHREPMKRLDEAVLKNDDVFWRGLIRNLVGKEPLALASVHDLCRWTERIYLNHEQRGFDGDPSFLQDMHAQRAFGKARADVADVYAWRAKASDTREGREDMAKRADEAFRQAIALCPYRPEILSSYRQFLKSLNREDEGRELIRIARKFKALFPEDVEKLRKL
jgi:hypothetical protein